MIIRSEAFEDIDAIYRMTADAFAPQEYSDGTEPDIINGLRRAASLKFSFVAEENGVILGHVAISPVAIEGHTGWYGLGPIAVTPKRQKQGIGSALMQRALSELSQINAGGCVLVGDPAYYERFGFSSNGTLTYADVPTEYVQFNCLNGSEPSGEIIYHRAFGGA